MIFIAFMIVYSFATPPPPSETLRLFHGVNPHFSFLELVGCYLPLFFSEMKWKKNMRGRAELLWVGWGGSCAKKENKPFKKPLPKPHPCSTKYTSPSPISPALWKCRYRRSRIFWMGRGWSEGSKSHILLPDILIYQFLFSFPLKNMQVIFIIHKE